ncbi:MAG: hypothetical protein AB1656_23225 [Candidatus Omnitrophota bacterium]
MPNESQIINQEILKTLVGFPIDLSEINADEKLKERRFKSQNHEYYLMTDEILKMYWSGSLVKEKRDTYLQSIFTEEFRKKSHFPIKGIKNLMAVYYRNPDEIDSLRVLAAIFASGQLGAIQDIKPYLEYATVFVGDSQLATGFLSFVYSIDMADIPEVKITPSQRLKYWPSACAIFNNTNAAVPKLLDAVKDKNLREDLRLRSAAFINTIDPSVIDQELLDGLEPAMAEKVQCIKKKSLKWRHMLYNVCEDTSERDKKDEQLHKKSMAIPDGMTVEEARKIADEDIWGKY